MRSKGRTPPDRFYSLAVVVLIGLSIARLVPTYSTLTQVVDEPYHLACGTEWLEGKDDCGFEHPPLARVAVALGPWLKGIRATTHDGDLEEGNEILYARGEYFQNLTLARIGTLPFLILACVVTYLWARRWFGAATGFWAVFLFLNIPPVLGHAGFATTDMAACATVLAAVYQWARWIETPGWGRAVVLALAVSVALLSKFSSIVFLPACFAAVLILASLRDRKIVRRIAREPWVRQGCIGVVLIGICLWAGYRFTLAPVLRNAGAHPTIERYTAESTVLRKLADVPLPLTTMIRGVHRIYDENHQPIPSYFLGAINAHGNWAFFPVVLAVKTPIGVLLLAIGGLAVVLRHRENPWTWFATAASGGALLLVCMTSEINMGVRHALAIYPFVAIVAGHAVVEALRCRHRLLVAASALLVGWVFIESWIAHPDYLAYFNQLAAGRPENIVADSDLDWGQDLQRLSERLKVRGIQDVSIAYFGSARLEEAGLPRYRVIGPGDAATGYIAVSLRFTTRQYAINRSYGWVRSLIPIERIGKSINLYYVPD